VCRCTKKVNKGEFSEADHTAMTSRPCARPAGANNVNLRFRKSSAILERILLQGEPLGVLSQQVKT
jgi:hypothetical protein